jgi:acetyltransferase-like isoleucine patch superfamily enzyme
MLCPRVEVGREAVVAAGSVVMEDVPEAVLVMGNPARIVRKVPEDEFLP